MRGVFMAIYLVENEEANINNWGCYWLVKASSKKEAVDRVYCEENGFVIGEGGLLAAGYTTDRKYIAKAARYSGILKRKLSAVKVDERLFCGDNTYMIK